jgi:hypothetical protein
MLLFFSSTAWYPLSLLYVVGAEIGSSLGMLMVGTLLMINSSFEMRGRVMGVRMLAIFPLSVGNIIAGMLAQTMGSPATLVILGISYLLSISGTILLVPKMRKLE